MKTGIRAGNSYKNYYKRYKDSAKWRENKLKRMEARLLVNEDDKGAAQAIKVLNAKTHSRQKPGSKGWFHPQEITFKKMAASSDPAVAHRGREKLAKITAIYNDSRPSAIRSNNETIARETMADKLFREGLINAKRRETVNTRMARLQRR